MSKINRDFYLEVDDDQQIVWPKDGNTPYNAFNLVRIYIQSGAWVYPEGRMGWQRKN